MTLFVCSNDFLRSMPFSNGRAQVILGRGSFTESFPLFGYDLKDYEELFEEKLNYLVNCLKKNQFGKGK